MAKYIIHKTILFDSTTAKLSFVDERDPRAVNLSTPGARCLEHLFLCKGTVVTKNALIELSWRNLGFEVSESSVNHAIFQIRKCFSYMSMDKNIIVTVPRQGYQLNPDYCFDTLESFSEQVHGQLSEEVMTVSSDVEGVIPTSKVENKKQFWRHLVDINLMFTVICLTTLLHFVFTYGEHALELTEVKNTVVKTELCLPDKLYTPQIGR